MIALQPTTALSTKLLQFPIRTIPAQQLLDPCDVFREEIVEGNSLLPIHRPLIWNDVPVFTAHRTERFETEK